MFTFQLRDNFFNIIIAFKNNPLYNVQNIRWNSWKLMLEQRQTNKKNDMYVRLEAETTAEYAAHLNLNNKIYLC